MFFIRPVLLILFFVINTSALAQTDEINQYVFFDEANVAIKQKDFDRAYELYNYAIEAGSDFAAIMRSAYYVKFGESDEQVDRGVSTLKYYADRGEFFAQDFLAKLYFAGINVPTNYEISRGYFKRHALTGRYNHFLGKIYYEGLGVERSVGTAVFYLLYPYPLGSLNKAGIEKNLKHIIANENLVMNAENGDADSQFALGLLHWDGDFGFEKSESKSLGFFRLASSHGHPLAKLLLTDHACYGEDESEKLNARKYIEQLAKSGLDEAQFKLSQELLLGGCGFNQDWEQGIYWLLKAEKQNHPSARGRLQFEAGMLKEKEGKVPDNLKRYLRDSEWNKYKFLPEVSDEAIVQSMLKYKDSEDPVVTLVLAKAFYYGEGVEADKSKALDLLLTFIEKYGANARIEQLISLINGEQNVSK